VPQTGCLRAFAGLFLRRHKYWGCTIPRSSNAGFLGGYHNASDASFLACQPAPQPVHLLLMIRKLQSGEYRLYSRKKDAKTGRRKNLGTFSSLAAAKKHERAVQYFKRA